MIETKKEKMRALHPKFLSYDRDIRKLVILSPTGENMGPMSQRLDLLG